MQRPHRINLNADWQFQFEQQRPETVHLPHSWNALDTMEVRLDQHYRRGVGVYTKRITPPTLTERLWLEIEAASQKAKVYQDGLLIGEHAGGYTAFTVEITARQPFELRIEVDNRPDPDLIPSDMSDFFLYGGLTRNLWLYATGQIRLEKIFIDTQIANKQGFINFRGSLSDTASQPLTLEVEITEGSSANTTHFALSASRDFQFDLTPVQNPRLWSPDQPHLYIVSVKLMQNEKILDHLHLKIGFRTFEFPIGGAFYLNGERLLLKGTHRHEDWAGYGSAVPDELTCQELVQIKAAGFNFIRLGHYPQTPIVLEMCDALGILVWEELPWCRGGVGGDLFKTQTKNMLIEMIEQHYHHPSIIFWGLGNELDWESEHPASSDEKVAAFLTELHNLSHERDSSRLTALRRFEPGASIVDVYSPSIWSGWYRGRYEDYETALLAAIALYPRFLHMEWGGDSHVGRHSAGPHLQETIPHEINHEEVPGLALSTDGPVRASRDGDWSESYMLDVMEWHLQVQAKISHLAGTAQWVFKDFGTPLRPENPIPYINQKGLVDRAGCPKDVYFLFQAYFTDTPVCYIESPTWKIRVGQPDELQRVRVYSNCETVELFINEVSQGKKVRDVTAFPASGLVWHVPFKLGQNQLIAVGTGRDGKERSHEISQRFVLPTPAQPPNLISELQAISDTKVLFSVQLVDHAETPLTQPEQVIQFEAVSGGHLLKNQGTAEGSQVVTTANGRAAIWVICQSPEDLKIVCRIQESS